MIKTILRDGYRIDKGWQMGTFETLRDFRESLRQIEYFHNYFKDKNNYKVKVS